jgi:hypothetical protein
MIDGAIAKAKMQTMTKPTMTLPMTMVRTLALLAVPAVALAAPPRGKRSPRPKPTHLVISEAALTTSGAPGTLLPGVAVVAPNDKPMQKGKVKVTTLGGVEIAGTIDGAALGLRVGADTAFVGEDGKTTLGLARAGALVRVVGARGADQAVVETAGAFVVRGLVPTKVLVAEPGDLVITVSWNYETRKPTELWADQTLAGKARARLPEGVRVEYYEKAGDVAHVRTVAGVELDGWTPIGNLRERAAPPAQAQPPRLIAPSHEAFVDAPIFADAAGKKRLGLLRGGALVEVNARATRDARAAAESAAKRAPAKAAKAEADSTAKAGSSAQVQDTVKVTTAGSVVVEGWVRESDLRALSQKAMGQ